MTQADVVYQYHRLRHFFGKPYAIMILRAAEHRFLISHNDAMQSIYCQVLWDIHDHIL